MIRNEKDSTTVMKRLIFAFGKLGRMVGAVALAVFLAACASHPETPCQAPYLNYGEFCTEETQCRLTTVLKKEGVIIYFYGDHLYLMVLTDRLFNERGVSLTEKGEKILDDMALFLSCYQKVSVKVTGFSGELPVRKENVSFSTLQADAVVKYLWNKCIRARMIYARGGATNPLSHQMSGKNHLMIETERLP